MTRFSAYLLCALAVSAFGCGGTTYTTEDSGAGTGGAIGSGGSSSGGTGSGTGGSSATGGGGNVSTNISAASFEQSCQWDSQCQPVFEGNVCGCNLCANAAINGSARSQYDAAKSSIECPMTDVFCPGAPCQELVGSCQSGKCGVRPQVIIDETTFGDQNCDSNDTCTVIPGGELCSECKCTGVAVNASGKAQYDELLAGAKCTGGLAACDCVGLPTAAFCDSSKGGGVCRLAL